MAPPSKKTIGSPPSIVSNRKQPLGALSRSNNSSKGRIPVTYYDEGQVGPQSHGLPVTTDLIVSARMVWNRVNSSFASSSISFVNDDREGRIRHHDSRIFCVDPLMAAENVSVDRTRFSSASMASSSYEYAKFTDNLLPFRNTSTLPWPAFMSHNCSGRLQQGYRWMNGVKHAEAVCKENKGIECCSNVTQPLDEVVDVPSTNVDSNDSLRRKVVDASPLLTSSIDSVRQDIRLSDCVMRTKNLLIFRNIANVDFSSRCEFSKLLDEIGESRQNQWQKVDQNVSRGESFLNERRQHVSAAQEHAFAGAFAGTFVSLCLHPVDTVKTFLQSRHVSKNSAWPVGISFISERGVLGLYRGFVSKIACSAPISGIYTVTYESTKNVLAPLVSKEYNSFAHCISGGCASIATSFVFTPSELVKQQMQVGLHYQNCWMALTEIIRKGGLPSLYTGWGAVLCRNIPHSVIKFCAYENLKELVPATRNSSGQPNTVQTLVCGGLAGSAASLFSTPFDVVKTRLQTQMVGSPQYEGVLHALKDITRREGLSCLFRGLLPRILMYMSQGALFFTSYEFLKEFLLL